MRGGGAAETESETHNRIGQQPTPRPAGAVAVTEMSCHIGKQRSGYLRPLRRESCALA